MSFLGESWFVIKKKDAFTPEPMGFNFHVQNNRTPIDSSFHKSSGVTNQFGNRRVQTFYKMLHHEAQTLLEASVFPCLTWEHAGDKNTYGHGGNTYRG